MHRASLSTCTSALTSRELSENSLNGDAHKVSPSMNTVRWNDAVLFSHRGFHANSDSFLTGIEMTKATNGFLLVETASRCFESSDRLHFSIHIEWLIVSRLNGRWGCIVEIVGLVWLQGVEKEMIAWSNKKSKLNVSKLSRLLELEQPRVEREKIDEQTVLFVNKNQTSLSSSSSTPRAPRCINKMWVVQNQWERARLDRKRANKNCTTLHCREREFAERENVLTRETSKVASCVA